MKRRLLIRNITAEEKQALRTGTISFASFISGMGFYNLFNSAGEASSEVESNEENVLEDINSSTETLTLETKFDVLECDDTMSFNEAFANARETLGPGGFFEWRGNSYHTYKKEEINELDLSGSNHIDDFVSNVNFQPETNYASNPIAESEIDEKTGLLADKDQDGILDYGAEQFSTSELTSDDLEIIKELDQSIEGSENVDNTQDVVKESIESKIISKETDVHHGTKNEADLVNLNITGPDSPSGITSIMETLDKDNDGIIDLGAETIHTEYATIEDVKGEMIELGSTMETLDENNDGIIDFGSQNIKNDYASIVEDLDEDNDGIIDFGSSNIQDDIIQTGE